MAVRPRASVYEVASNVLGPAELRAGNFSTLLLTKVASSLE